VLPRLRYVIADPRLAIPGRLFFRRAAIRG
jgi:hypothetical protein